MGMYNDIDTYLYSDGSRPYDAASGRYFTSSSLSSGVNFVYSFAGNTPVDRTTAAVNHDRNSTVPSFGSVFVEQFGNNIDPRVFGFAQAAFGISEMLVGTAFAWTGVGLLVTANGADDAWAGIATMYYGEHVHTLKYRALHAATGSETVATIGEIGAGLASGDAVSRLNHLAKLAKHAQQASNVGEAVVRTADNAVETFANSADNFAVSAASQSPVKRFELPTIQSWCFAPDTLIDTPQGKRRIDEIHENDLVFAFDFTSGQWVERPVEVCHRNLYQGSLIEISTKHGTVVATAYHPFWVLEGHDLANRPRPRKLADTEDEGLALRGRWVNSHDLMAGDLIYSTEGRELRVLKIVQTYEEQFEVCNLTIAQNHSFAVGNDGVLVHNTGGCPKATVGGLGYPGSMPGRLSGGKLGFKQTHEAVSEYLIQGKSYLRNLEKSGAINSVDVLRIRSTAVLQRVAQREADKLSQTPGLLRKLLSEDQLAAIRREGAYLEPMFYGSVLEKELVVKRIELSPMLSRMFKHVGNGGRNSTVDFVGLGKLEGLRFDLTTIGERSGKEAIYGSGVPVPVYSR